MVAQPSSDPNVEQVRLKGEIRRLLGMNENEFLFDYEQQDGIYTLNGITVNPRHNQSFLFHTVRGVDKVDALHKMLAYVKEHHKEENSYTIQWMQVGKEKLHTSYFRGHNVYEVLDKFFYGRERHAYKIFSITLNPVT